MNGTEKQKEKKAVAINFYNIDCVEFMKTKPDNYYDLAIVDPPYGIGFDGHDQIIGKKGTKKGFSSKKLYDIKKWDIERPNEEYFQQLKRVSKNQIIWGGNYFADMLAPTKGWIYWDKKPNGENLTFSDGELAYTSFNRPLKSFSYGWIGFEMINSGEKKIHPTQKPKDLYRWILRKYSEKGQKILDTHGGSMSSAIACDMEGFDLDICEIDSDYFNAGVSRFNLYKRQGVLF